MRSSNALLLLPQGNGSVQPGEWVTAYLTGPLPAPAEKYNIHCCKPSQTMKMTLGEASSGGDVFRKPQAVVRRAFSDSDEEGENLKSNKPLSISVNPAPETLSTRDSTRSLGAMSVVVPPGKIRMRVG